MKKIILIIIGLIIVNDIAKTQAYLGHTNNKANLRAGIVIEYSILRELPNFSNLFVFKNVIENNYYHVINIESATEGYIYKDYVEFDKEIPKSN